MKIGTWQTFIGTLNYDYINNNVIYELTEEFKNSILDKLDNNSNLLLKLVIWNKGSTYYRNISNIRKVNKILYKNIPEIFCGFWELKSEEYQTMLLDPILIINYYIVPSNVNLTSITEDQSIDKKKKLNILNNMKFKGYKLPNTMDYLQWGEYRYDKDTNEYIIYKKRSNNIYILKKDSTNLEHLVKYKTSNNETLLSFKDIKSSTSNLQTFTRKIYLKNNEITYKFINGEIVYQSKKKIFEYFKTIKKESRIKDKIITMDLETRVINNIITPYCCSIYDGVNLSSFFLTNFKNKEEMLKTAFKSLFKRKYKGVNVYFHNFGKFDMIFLFNLLSEFECGMDILFNGNTTSFINFKLYFSNSKYYYLNIRDSFLLLPSSLKTLAKNMQLKEGKSIFPHRFVNTVSLDYEGKVPSFEFFDDISKDEYTSYLSSCDSTWNLKKEAIKYCEQDVKVLYNVIIEFNKDIFLKNRINAINYSTLPSLSLAIYKSNYLEEEKFKIPKITGNIYDFINKSYFGGHVDVYKPFNKVCNINKVYRYDVNSLYPFVMANFFMPVGQGLEFEGNIFEYEKDPFGFFEVIVETTKDLKHPILPFRSEDKKYGNRTIYPLGKWKGVYFSEELKNAEKYGYKYKVIRGILFEKEIIFSEFVKDFYEQKLKHDKTSSLYMESKLILNSLYGKFGMSPYKDKHKIFKNLEFNEFLDKINIKDVISLQKDKQLVTYKELNTEVETLYSPDISIGISSAITSYARIHMSQFKNNSEFQILYTDTDSIDISTPLKSEFVGKELGKMKLEGIFDKTIYLGPKVYKCVSNLENLVKIKGFKNKDKNINLEPLLYKYEKLLLVHEKWYKDLNNSEIKIIEEIYTLMVNSKKRILVYNENDFLVDTKPIYINEI